MGVFIISSPPCPPPLILFSQLLLSFQLNPVPLERLLTAPVVFYSSFCWWIGIIFFFLLALQS